MLCYINGKQSTLSDMHEDPLARSVLISLFSWRRAAKDDVLPGKTRFGWWGDTFAGKDQIGSRLWLLAREKMTNDVISRAQEYAKEALDWMIADGVASEVIVHAERPRDSSSLNIMVTIVRPDRAETSVRFVDVWRNK